MQPGHRKFAHATRFGLARDQFDRDVGRVSKPRQAERAEAPRLCQIRFEPDSTADRGGHAEQQPAFDLLFNDVGIDVPPAIDRRDDSVDADRLSFPDMRFDQHRDVAPAKAVAGDALAATRDPALPAAE